MINVSQLNQRYGGSQILWDLNMDIAAGSRTCIMGRNGVGKTTLLKCLMGMLPAASGSITINQQDVTRASIESRANIGVGYVPQGRHIFGQLTVEENLKVSLNCKRQTSRSLPEDIFEYFPVLKEMLQRRGGDLSGGQQQQLAIARALVLNPNMLILDEPNEGIQPNIIQQIGGVLRQLVRERNMTVVLVEQYVDFVREFGQTFYIMDRGRVVVDGETQALSQDLIQQHLSV